MSGQTLIPAVLAGVVALFTSELNDVEVIDGPYFEAPTGDFVTVGWSPGDTDEINAEREPKAVGGGDIWTSEAFEIPCYLDTKGGESGSNSEVADRRITSYALLDDITASLLADPTVGGATGGGKWAVRLSRHRLHLEKTEAGLEFGIVFYLTCYSLI